MPDWIIVVVVLALPVVYGVGITIGYKEATGKNIWDTKKQKDDRT